VVALVLLLLIMFGTLAIEVGHFFVVRNELKNAADAGALAGAQTLFDETGQLDPTAVPRAVSLATENMSLKLPVEAAAEVGNWSFTPSGGIFDTTPGVEVNACRAVATRSDAPTLLARIFGKSSFTMQQDAVAYIGFAGTTVPGEINAPIVLCQQALQDSTGAFSCTVGRMINSGNQTETFQTGGLSNFAQPCVGAASTDTILPLVCAGGNPRSLYLDQEFSTTGGMVTPVYDGLKTCWQAAGLDTNGDGKPDQPWSMRLPVIDCPGSNVGPCSKLTGVVEIEVLWMTGPGDKNKYNEVPRRMDNWSCGSAMTGEQCWQSFVDNFNLKRNDGVPLTYEDKTMYFKPVCQAHEVAGRTGGGSFGVRAKFPVLVK
jgi:Flp pilus assembly protein TadG